MRDREEPPAVVLLSGGLDSATTLAIARREGFACHALSFDYGQRHRFELHAAARVARAGRAASHRVVRLDLSAAGGFGRSALTDDIAVPKDRSGIGPAGSQRRVITENDENTEERKHSTEESTSSRRNGQRHFSTEITEDTEEARNSKGEVGSSTAGNTKRDSQGRALPGKPLPFSGSSVPSVMDKAVGSRKSRIENPELVIPVTYVPARNTIFLSIALGYAEVISAFDIFIGVNAVDYSGYPDCRPEFIEAFERTANLATAAGVQSRGRFRIRAPLIRMTKAEIIRVGLELGVDYSLTHSCYDPSAEGLACGRCDACRLRLKGFAEAGATDPAEYQEH